MRKRVIRLSLDDARWRSFVAARPDAEPFHHPSWARLLADCYGYPAFALALADAAGEITAGIPVIDVRVPLRGRKWASLPFTDACPPLGRAPEDAEDLVGEVQQAARATGVRRVELRADVGRGCGHLEQAGVLHRLRLEGDPDAVFRRFHRSQVQRNVRRSEREGVEVRRAEAPSGLTEVFYSLHVKTRHRQGVPTQPRRYFQLLWDRVLSLGLGHVSLAYRDGAPIAGAVFLRWNGTLVYKYGASDPDYWSLRPNHLIFWDAIRSSCESGDHTVDFGRTELSNTGLRAFKAGWGAEEAPLNYVVLGDRPSAPARDPAAALRPVLRRAPAWSCRALGALFYRYAA
ncbi:MAG: GNAT family N-acetyltransferase [Actinomycetota bacterium]|nr:GNAT family N-acetyltransferase [Actinomycetota bacterium]